MNNWSFTFLSNINRLSIHTPPNTGYFQACEYLLIRLIGAVPVAVAYRVLFRGTTFSGPLSTFMILFSFLLNL